MRVPLGWLREYVDLPADATPEHLHAALVRVGLEEETVHAFELSGPIVVGQVIDAMPEPQSNGKTITWCQVDVGEAEPRGIVCGAHNFGVGDKVVVSLPGAVLPGPFPIAARTTYGHVSDGMIASARELGLGDEHDGILRLAAFGLDPAVGTDAISLLGLDDTAVEVNVTPDRGYAFSIRGIAREYSHSTGAQFRDPAGSASPRAVDSVPAAAFPVTIDDRAPIRGRVGATVFVTRLVRDVDPSRPTPPWMISRLALAGVRSISLIVDITNYVMFELGQPIHAYDFDRLAGGITVRRAVAGETLQTLDGQTRTLDAEDLLITDESGPIGLAGVMGGATTEIGGATTAVLIEAANFDPVSIARTARRHKLPSEASRRFERGVDPAVAASAAARVVHLLEQLAGGRADSLGSALHEHAPAASIRLAHGFVSSIVGVDYTDGEIETSLLEIGAVFTRTDAALEVTPPTWRPDLTDQAALAEEVARILGYDRIPAVLPTAPPGRGLTREQRSRRSVAQQLAAAGGTEVLSSPFLSRAAVERFTTGQAIRLANPLDAEAPFLRTSLVPGLVEVARRNLSRGLTDLALFEIGTVFLPGGGAPHGSGPLPPGNSRPDAATLATLNAGIPPQPRHAGGLILGDVVRKHPGQSALPASLADAIGAAHQVASAVGASISVRQGSRGSLHPGRTAELILGGESIGFAGELLPSLAAQLDLPRVVAVWELDLDALVKRAPTDVNPTPIASFPAATQDLSLVVPVETPAGEVLAAVVAGAGSLLELARIADDYRGAGVAEGTKSITLALRFRSPDRTLTAREATDAKLAGAAVAASRFGATIRE